jgi:hypothetical protein
MSFGKFDCDTMPGCSRASLAKSTEQNVGNCIQTTEKIQITAMSFRFILTYLTSVCSVNIKTSLRFVKRHLCSDLFLQQYPILIKIYR